MNIDELRDYYDRTDTADALQRAIDAGEATWDPETQEDPLIGTSIRLPRSLLDQVREEATRRHVPVTTLMRGWIIDALRHAPVPSPEQGNDLIDAVEKLRSELEGTRQALRQIVTARPSVDPAQHKHAELPSSAGRTTTETPGGGTRSALRRSLLRAARDPAPDGTHKRQKVAAKKRHEDPRRGSARAAT